MKIDLREPSPFKDFLPLSEGLPHPLLERLPLTLFLLGVFTSFAMSTLGACMIFKMPWPFAVLDSLVYHLTYTIFALSLWFYVRFSWPLRLPLWKLVIFRVSVVASVLIIWGAVSYGILDALFTGYPEYQYLLELSLPAHIAGGLPYFLLVIMGYLLYIFVEDRRTRLENERMLQDNLREAELELLKSQINPHFLFNSLNSVSLLTLNDPERAHHMIIALSDYLRYSISGHKGSMTPLEKELENVNRYLEIEKIRFGQKLKVKFLVETGCGLVKIPAMLLQPLFENAIKHGVYESTRQVEIRTAIKINADGLLEISIENDFEKGRIARKGAGLGLVHVRERLRMAYGHGQSYFSTVQAEQVFTVNIRIPQEARHV